MLKKEISKMISLCVCVLTYSIKLASGKILPWICLLLMLSYISARFFVSCEEFVVVKSSLFPKQADTLKERYQKIGDTKRATPIEVLCESFPG